MPCTSGWWTRFFSGVVFDLQRQFRSAAESLGPGDRGLPGYRAAR
jgi:hypothetical protein